jgi:hypothetical protein
MNTATDSPNESKSKLITLFGSTQIMITREDGTAEEVRVRQLRLVEYQPALKLVGDEMAITGFCTSLNDTPAAPCNKDFILQLHPKSYEALVAKVREVNAEGFFYYAARRQADEDAINARWLKQAADLPPEVLKAAFERGSSLSGTSSPRPR